MENVDEVLINFMVNEVSMHCLSDIGKGIFNLMLMRCFWILENVDTVVKFYA